MAVPWPASLEQRVNEDGYGLQFGDPTMTSDMDSGPPKKRARSTKGIDIHDCTMRLKIDQYTVLKNFYKTDLNQGVLTFEFNHPITGVLTEFQFVSPPRITPMGGEYFMVSMQWREMF